MGHGQHWTPAEDHALRTLLSRGHSRAEIARQLDRPVSGVKRRIILLGHGATPSRPWTTTEDDSLRAGNDAGQTRAQIAAVLGRSPAGIKRRVLALGLGGAPSRPWTAAEDETIRLLRLTHVSHAEIARRLGRSRGAVAVRAVVCGLTTPRPPQWTAAERARLDMLIEQHVPYAEIARRMRRGITAVIHQASAMQVPLSTADAGATAEQVARRMGVHRRQVATWITAGHLRTVPSGMDKPLVLVPDEALWDCLGQEETWHLFDPAAITDRHLRAYATEVRGGRTFLGVAEAAAQIGLTHGGMLSRIRKQTQTAVLRGRKLLIRSDWLRAQPEDGRYHVPHRPWTDAENADLRASYGREPLPDLARRLQRTEDAVYAHAGRLGLMGSRNQPKRSHPHAAIGTFLAEAATARIG